VLGLGLILSQVVGMGGALADASNDQLAITTGSGGEVAATADAGQVATTTDPTDAATTTDTDAEVATTDPADGDVATTTGAGGDVATSADAGRGAATTDPSDRDVTTATDAGRVATTTDPPDADDDRGSFASDATKADAVSGPSDNAGNDSPLSPAALTGSNVSIDLMAAGPFSYDHVTLAGTGPNLPRVSDDKTIDKATGVVESLEGGDFACGDDVVFFAEVTSVGGTGSGTLTFDVALLAEPTGQPGVGFDDIVDAETMVNPQDDAAGGANVRDGNETVSLTDEHLDTSGPNDQIVGTVTLTDLDAGETVVVRIVGHLGCEPGAEPTGNLQADILGAELDGVTVPVGNQTIPFKKVEDIVQAAIEVSKTSDAGTVQAGGQIGFTITVTNGGNVSLSDVTLTDPLPSAPGVTWTIESTSGDTNGLSCSIASATLTCTKASLGLNGSFDVHVTSPTNNDSCKTYDNTASVTSGDLSDSASASIVVEGCVVVDLGLTKSADAAVVTAGNQVTFTIDVTNDGTTAAQDVHVTDSIQPGATIDSADFTGGSKGPADCDVSGQDIDCDLGTLNAGESTTVTIVVTVGTANCPVLTNTASVTADNETGGQGDNSDTVTVDVTCAASVTLVKDNDANQDGTFHDTETAVSAAQAVDFRVVITNTSAVPVTIESLTDVYPGLSDPENVECDDLGQGGAGSPVGTTLTPGESLTCFFTLSGYSPAAGGSKTDTVAVTVSSQSGAAGASDTSTVNTPGASQPPSVPLGIQIIKDGPALAHVGDTITYTFDVSLTTSTPLTAITVTDPICSAAPTLDSRTGGDQDERLEPGETWHFRCRHDVTALDPDPLPNTATVRGTDDRGRSTTDTDDHVVDIIHPAIRVVKTASRSSITPGQTVTYTYTVTNIGDVTLFDLSVDDDKLGHVCNIPRLAVDETRTCTKDFTTDETNLGPVKNVVVATGKDETGYPVQDEDRLSIDVVLGVTVTPSPVPTTSAPQGTAFTGSSAVLPLAALALALLGVGSGLIYLGRRREGGAG
jgi:uncharacterized repeat protein (TIGR01451 family)